MTETQALLHLDPTYATHGNPETVVKRMWAIIDAYNSQAATVDSGVNEGVRSRAREVLIKSRVGAKRRK